jgi:hypothetical protein
VLFSLYNCTVIEENNMSNRLNFYDNIVSVGGRGTSLVASSLLYYITGLNLGKRVDIVKMHPIL